MSHKQQYLDFRPDNVHSLAPWDPFSYVGGQLRSMVVELASPSTLADVFPEAGLAPPNDERADYYRWLFFAAGPVEAAVTNKAMHWETPPDSTNTRHRHSLLRRRSIAW